MLFSPPTNNSISISGLVKYFEKFTKLLYVCSAKSRVGSIIIALVNFIAFVFLSSFFGSFSNKNKKMKKILLTAPINICDEFPSSNPINDLSVGGY